MMMMLSDKQAVRYSRRVLKWDDCSFRIVVDQAQLWVIVLLGSLFWHLEQLLFGHHLIDGASFRDKARVESN